MDEARRVIARLGRIEALRAAGAEPRTLLSELRELVREGQEWASAEGQAAGAARAALGSLDHALAEGPNDEPRAPDTSEEVVVGDAAF